MPVSSLPSPYGIGTFGQAAYDFVDQLANAGQKYWQVLPLGPTSYGDSPYASFSAFAGNHYFIDLDMLIEEGLITEKYVKRFKWNMEDAQVDYGLQYRSRFKVLRKAFMKSKHAETKEYKEFVKENKFWLDDYSLYFACKHKYENISWQNWDDDIKFRKRTAITRLKKELAEDIAFHSFIQFKFYEQWTKLKAYANEKGIQIIGDIPLYMAMDSADIWTNTKQYQLDKDLRPEAVAGVPADSFSELGQRWGNPLYDWDEMEKDDFAWWRKRMEYSAKIYDVIRIDHFLGIVKYYAIPPEDPDALGGEYHKGPGKKLIKVFQEAIGDKKIIAEDLGIEMPEAVRLMDQAGYPGMKVLEFAFDGDRENEHLPYNYKKNLVVYGGTHDNDTLMGYFSGLKWWDLSYVREYVGDKHASIEYIVDTLFRVAYSSVADLVIFQLQDVLKMNTTARINIPSTMGTNWRWRLLDGEFTEDDVNRLKYFCDIYGR